MAGSPPRRNNGITKSPRSRGDFSLLAAVVAANVASAAAAEDDEQGQNVAQTSEAVATAAAAEQNEYQKDTFTAATAAVTVCEKVHSMYLLSLLGLLLPHHTQSAENV